ncbi:MAG TPA: single-stranded DNA-binding protein [Actinomycetota bacterium]|nr:single-stranded DNA-binding protein [Actinomycetota bacterium]
MSNQVTIVGNLTRDPELRYTPNGAAVVKFGVAVNRSYTNRNGEKVEQTDFFTVNAWRQLAENVAESLKVGSRVIVSGRLQARTWETEGGDKRSTVEIEADEIGPSLRWASATIVKPDRGGPGEWHTEPQASDSSAGSMSGSYPQEVHAAP